MSVMKEGMKVAIGVPTPEIGPYSIFWDSLLHVRGVSPENVFVAKGANVSENRNGLGAIAVEQGYDAILYVDSDQVVWPNTLEALASHDKDIVSGLYLSRELPFAPQVYNADKDPDEGLGRITATGGEKIHFRQQLLTPLRRGLVKAGVVGAGCLLVKTDVLRKMEPPWWRLGEVDGVSWSDDTGFCLRAGLAGFEIWCDLNMPIGHQVNGTIVPVYDKNSGEWATALTIGRQTVMFPAAK